MVRTILGDFDARSCIYLASTAWGGWISIYGVIILIVLLIPNILYSYRFRDSKNLCKYKWLNVIEQIGRYATMFFLVVPIGVKEFGFSSVERFFIYLIGNSSLLIMYWMVWLFYFKKQGPIKGMMLAILPTMIFLLNGVLLHHVWLILSASIFGLSHCFVTYQNVTHISADRE